MTPLDPIALVQTLVAIIKRRFELFLLPAFVLLPGGYLAFKKLPRKYKASTKIVIQEPKHSNPFLGRFTSPTRLKKRIMLLQNIVSSHKVLGQLVDREARAKGVQLSPRARHYAVMGMRRKIKIMYMGQGLVQLEFSCKIPKKCVEHLNFVFAQFLKETWRPQKQAVRRSSRFLARQIKRLHGTLKKTEKALTRYKQKHSLELPQTFRIHLKSYTHLRKRLTQARIDLTSAMRRRDFLYRKVRFLDPILVRMKQKRTRLLYRISQARSRYTSRHPRMRRLRVLLRRINASIRRHTPKKARTLEQIEKSMRFYKSARELYKSSDSDKARQRSISPFERLQETLLQIAVLKKRIDTYEHKSATFKKRMSAYPQRELRLEVLKREAVISRQLYVKLRSLYEESLLRRELELFDSSSRVFVVEPAILPLFPTSPKAPLVLGGAFVASFMVSIFLIAVAEISDRTIKSIEEAHKTFDVEILGSMGNLPPLRL